jgi:hypothetical protein
MTPDSLAVAICCEGKPCLRPEACDAHREYRVPVSPTKAAEAVRALLCHRWRDWPRVHATVTFGGEE